jgi:hypothetical protein
MFSACPSMRRWLNSAIGSIGGCCFAVSSFCFICCCVVLSVSGQQKPEVLQLLRRSHELVKAHEPAIFPKPAKTVGIDILDQFVAQATDHYIDVYQSELNVQNHGIDSIRRENGLRLSAGFYENFGEMLLTEDGVFFRRRAFVGVDWDIVQSGWFQNQLRAKALALKVKEWKEKRQEMRFHYANRYINQCVVYYFNQQKLEKLTPFKQFVQQQVQQVQFLHQINYLPKQDVFRLQRLLQQLEIQEASCSTSQQQMRRFLDMAWIYPPLDLIAPQQLSLNLLVNELGKRQLDQRLESERIALMNQSYRVPYRWSAQPFVRYSFVQDANSASRDFFTVGLNFSTPLSFRREDRIKAARIEKLQIENRKVVSDQVFQILDYHQNYLEAVTAYQLKLSLLEEYREGIRIQLSQRSIDSLGYSPMETIGLMIRYLEEDLALVSFQQKVVQSLLPFYGINPAIRLADYAKPLQLTNSQNEPKIQKGIYIWSNAMKAHTPSFIIEYLTKHQMSTAYVSLSQQIEAKHWLGFQQLAQQRNIEVIAVIGNSDYIFEEKYGNWKEKIKTSVDRGVKRIHFDIEPHTLPNWANEKSKYLGLYQKMVYNIKQHCASNGIQTLSFAIPMHYPDSTLKVLATYADEVIIMAYETKSIESISRRTQEERLILGMKFRLAIRTKDFNTINEFITFSNQITSELKLDELIVHDLETYLQLESGIPDTKK